MPHRRNFNPIPQLDENFQLLLHESLSQVQRTFSYIESFRPALYEKIVERDDYIDNLKLTIENQCFTSLSRVDAAEKEILAGIRARQAICVNLEKIADYCVNICKQVDYLHEREFWLSFDYQPMCRLIEKTLNLVGPALQGSDIAGAMQICRSEPELDELFKQNFAAIMKPLRAGENVDTCVTILFIFRYMERMGDSLLNVGEAILLAILGEKIKIRQFEAMRQTLSSSELAISPAKLEVVPFLGTRSGCNISRLAGEDEPSSCAGSDSVDENRPREGLFKSGSPQKIIREKNNIEQWAALMPGLVPRIYTFHEDCDRVSMLVEFLPGQTLENILITCPWPEIEAVLAALKINLGEIWEKTRQPGPAPVDYMAQLSRRYAAVVEVHPGIVREGQQLDGLNLPATATLIEQCRLLENEVRAPFTVFGHGDFNVNNILFDQARRKIHYIDLYRSHQADYLEDVAVFLISNFRLPVFDEDIRSRLNRTIADIYAFARGFADRQEDCGFDLRLGLALARSFLTSTRFEQNRKFAREMALRGQFLLEKLADHQGRRRSPAAFRLPEAVLYFNGRLL